MSNKIQKSTKKHIFTNKIKIRNKTKYKIERN